MKRIKLLSILVCCCMMVLGQNNPSVKTGTTIYVAGTFNNWTLTPLQLDNGVWKIDSIGMRAGNQKMKFANTADWSGDDWGDATGLTGTAKPTHGAALDISFDIAAAGVYTISFNLQTLNYAVERTNISRLNNEMYAAGTFSEWNCLPMFFDGSSWKRENMRLEAGNQELKFVNTGNWSGKDWGDATGLSGIAKPATGGGPNIRFTIPVTGIYTIAFNDITLDYSITEVPYTMHVAGTFNNWLLTPMTLADGWWKLDRVVMLEGSQRMKFANTPNWSGDDWGDASGLIGTAKPTHGAALDISFAITESGYYAISFNLQSLQYKVEKSDIKKVNDKMYLAGTFTSWNRLPMTFDGSRWIIENVEIGAGDQRLKFVNTDDWSGQDWGNAMGSSGTASLATGGGPDIVFSVFSAGKYTVWFNDVTLEYSIREADVNYMITVNFAGSGAATRVDTVTATNQRTNESITFPGNETLLLGFSTEVPDEEVVAANYGKVYPNPFPGQATVTAVVARPQTVQLRIQNMLGQLIARTSEPVQPGENEFRLVVSRAGMYFVSITTDQGTSGYKVICTDAWGTENSLEYLGNRPDAGNYSTKALKSGQTNYSLGFMPGDVILYRCSSGIHTTILTDSPVDSKTYEAVFTACTDQAGKNYATVKIGDQTWMAENLAWLPAVSPPEAGSETGKHYYVKDYYGTNAAEAKASARYGTYGVLYNWPAAADACPDGWRLPDDADLTGLTGYLASHGYGYGGSGTDIGKSMAGWLGWMTSEAPGAVGNDQPGNNLGGFTALPGGYRGSGGTFLGGGSDAYFWTSSENGSANSWSRSLYFGYDGLYRNFYSRVFGFSVRCLKGGGVTTPTVATSNISGITPNSATGGGNVTSDGGSAVTQRGVCWSIGQDPAMAEHKTSDGEGAGTFTSSLTGLSAGTTYYVWAYAINGAGTAYGNRVNFTTLQNQTLPTVTTSPVTAINQTSATGGGNVTNAGSTPVTARGVCWSASPNPTTAGSKTSDGAGTGVFTSSLAGLTANNTYYVRAYATNSGGTAYGEQVSFSTGTVPVLTTSPVTQVYADEALSGGNITHSGGSDIIRRGVCWSTSPNPVIDNNPNKTDQAGGTGTYASLLSNLVPTTFYYVRAYATNSAGTGYGDAVTFTTARLLVPPTVTTTAVTGISQVTAWGGGNVTDDGGAMVTTRGICWSTSHNPDISNSKMEAGSGLGVFSSSLAGLSANTTYYVRAFAGNSAGTGYGSEVPFTTLPVVLPAVTTTPASAVALTTATSGGSVISDGGAPVTARGVCWSTSHEPTVAGSKTSDGSGLGTFTSSISGLTENTRYYVRAYATNSAGTKYGQEVELMTLRNIIPPTVTTTSPITEITQTTAKGGGNVTSDGGGTVTARGVCWSTSHEPKITDSKTSDGTGTGSFTSSLTGLTAGTPYYVRAYATNSAGTSYGQEVPFTSVVGNTGTFTDARDNRTYKWVEIGDQTWMAENLAYLPAVSPSATGSETALNYYVYGYQGTSVSTAKTQANYTTYGVLYNWPAAMTACPTGWYLPSDAEWTSLTDWLTNNGYGYGGSGSDIGKSIASTSGWTSSSTAGTVGNDQAINNSSGFTALPGGGRGSGGGFGVLGYYAGFWSSSEGGSSDAWGRGLYYYSVGVGQASYYRGGGFSVRCLQGAGVMPPTVTTTSPITEITQTTAKGGGNVTSDGGGTVTARGVCWSVSHEPTIANSKTSDGTGTGGFTSSLTGLTAGTPYYVRAYATNSAGTAYGQEVPFTSAGGNTGTFTDSRDNRTYKWVKIGDQTWMAENLAYLPAVSPSATGSETALNYYVYGYEGTSVSTAKTQANYTTYGVLYNWPAALTACPSGWHLPTDAEWTTLTDYLTNNGYGYGGSGSDIGKSMAATSGWTSSSTAGTVGNDQASNNRSGFTALPGGYRYYDGGFRTLGEWASFWSSSENGSSYARYRALTSTAFGANEMYDPRRFGFSVRCLQGAGVMPPTVTTTSPITEITQTTAKGGGNVTSDGGGTVTARGVCWSTSHDPTIAGNKTTDGAGTGSFTSSLTGLTAGTPYYVRAWATNSAGTAYGQEVPFTTAGGNTGTFTDSRDNRTYKWVKIGDQTWMAENLAYLPAVSPSATGSDTDANYYVYGYEGTSVSTAKTHANYTTYGALYNWPAAMTACPTGWHLPTDAEWTTLTDYLTNNGYGYGGSGSDIGKSMAATSGWTSSSTAGTVGNDQASNNRSGFTALPGGFRDYNGGFQSLGFRAEFWSSSEGDSSNARCRSLIHSRDDVSRGFYILRVGLSVRCLKN